MKFNNNLSPAKKKWAIFGIVIGVIGIIAYYNGYGNEFAKNNVSQTYKPSKIQQQNKKQDKKKDNGSNKEKPKKEDKLTYAIAGEKEGVYGRKIVLNKDSDFPVTKYLYKLPAGEYKVTTTNPKLATFFIAKDQTKITSDPKYPEELDYVGSSYMLTAGSDDFNGNAKKEVTITLKEDESVQTVGKDRLFFEKQ